MQTQNTKIEISTWSIVKLLLLVVSLFFLYYIRNVVAIVFVVVILVAGFTPFINSLVKQKIPRIFSVVILYLLIFALLTLIIYIIIPPLVQELSSLASNLGYYSSRFNSFNSTLSSTFFKGKNILDLSGQYVTQFSGGVVGTVTTVFGGAASALTVLVLTFYILAEQDSIEKFILTFVPANKKHHAIAIYNKISLKLGSWLRGQLVLAIIIGITSYIILSILGIKYALALAILAGILEIVPIVGPIVAGLAAIFITFVTGGAWWQILAIAISYLVVQQLESHFLVPKMMGKAVGLSPIIIIIALLIGGSVGGIVGAILAIPIAAGISVIVQEWSTIKNIE